MSQNNNPNFDFYSFNEKQPEKQTVESIPEQKTLPVEPDATVSAEGTAAPVVDLYEQKARMSRGYSRIGWAFVGVTVSWIVLTVILQSVAQTIAPQLLDTFWFEIVAGTFPLYVVCTPLLFLMLQGAPAQTPEKKKLSVPHFFLLLVLAEGVMVAGSLIGNGLMNVMSLLTGNDFQNQLNETFDIPVWLSFTVTVILAPIFEELIFRKLLLDRMLPYGELCAILINGVLFGAFHGNFFQFFYAAMLGMLLAFLYAKTGKLRHCILIHMCVNFLGGIVPTLIYDWLGYDTMMELMGDEAALAAYVAEHLLPYLATMAYSALQYGCAIAGFVIFTVNFRYFKPDKKPDLLPAKEGLMTSFLTPGIIASLVVCGLLFVMSLISSVAG